MSVSNFGLDFTMQASEALNNLTAGTGQIYKAIDNEGGIAPDNDVPAGILQYGGANGENITVRYMGESKFTAGAAVGNGVALSCAASGYMTAATSGDFIIGRVGIVAVASGEVGRGFFNFANPVCAVHSVAYAY